MEIYEDEKGPYTILKYKAKKTFVELDEKRYKCIRFGNERLRFSDSVKLCPVCNAHRGTYHYAGCDWEECPICHTQLLSCGCRIKAAREDRMDLKQQS